MKICPECHHRPSGRIAEYGAACQCHCHDIADAAPELLAACKEAMEFLSNGTPIYSGSFVQASIFNAIAKAEGAKP